MTPLAAYACGVQEKEEEEEEEEEEYFEKAYDTRCSQAVPHPSTILARRCLTAVIRREQVCSSWYGRRQRAFHSSSI